MTEFVSQIDGHPPSGNSTRSTISNSRGKNKQNGIVALCGPGPLPAIIINAVVAKFGPITIIQEDKEPTSVLLRRRFKLLGKYSTLGQTAFGVLLKLIHHLSKNRIIEIIRDADLKTVLGAGNTLINVDSVNDERTRAALKKVSPKVVLVVGTRMIRTPTLLCIDALFINYHAGINPLYRGMNGGYWALSQNDKNNAGVSIHLVDEGVDTGDVLYEARFEAKPNDNFVTYPFLQAAVARAPIIMALKDALTGNIKPIKVNLPSKQWFHPTIWSYLKCGLTRSVW